MLYRREWKNGDVYATVKREYALRSLVNSYGVNSIKANRLLCMSEQKLNLGYSDRDLIYCDGNSSLFVQRVPNSVT